MPGELEEKLSKEEVQRRVDEHVEAVLPDAKRHYRETGEFPGRWTIKDYLDEADRVIDLRNYPFSVRAHLSSRTDTTNAVFNLNSAINELRNQALEVVLKHIEMRVQHSIERETGSGSETAA